MSTFSLRKRFQSFGYAFRGVVTLFRSQPNAKIHAAATFAVAGARFVLAISPVDWALLALAAAVVWLAEALNTAIEFLADEISLEQRERIGRAKDVAAGGVLVSALAAAVVGFIVFVPPLCPLK